MESALGVFPRGSSSRPPAGARRGSFLQGSFSDLDSEYLLRHLQVKTYPDVGPSLKLWS